MASVTIEIPEIVLASHHQDMGAVKAQLQQGMVIWEYLNGHLSLRQCSELLQTGYRNFLELLWSKGIHIDGLSPEEVQSQADYLYQRIRPARR